MVFRNCVLVIVWVYYLFGGGFVMIYKMRKPDYKGLRSVAIMNGNKHITIGKFNLDDDVRTDETLTDCVNRQLIEQGLKSPLISEAIKTTLWINLTNEKGE